MVRSKCYWFQKKKKKKSCTTNIFYIITVITLIWPVIIVGFDGKQFFFKILTVNKYFSIFWSSRFWHYFTLKILLFNNFIIIILTFKRLTFNRLKASHKKYMWRMIASCYLPFMLPTQISKVLSITELKFYLFYNIFFYLFK